jgi:hypothetical protein
MTDEVFTVEPPRFARLERLAIEVLELIKAASDGDTTGRDVEVMVAAHVLEVDLARVAKALTGVSP